jgi:moderate conductance mechanosensitive channel
VSWSTTFATSASPTVTNLEDAQRSANSAADYIGQNWTGWLAAGLQILLILVIAFVLRTIVRRTISRLIERMNRSAEAAQGTALGSLLVNAERRRQRSQAIGSVMRSIASFVIMGTAALTVLSVLQINLAPLLASAGVAGVAIGFGARNLVTDFLSGVFMILEDQYGVGDAIDAGVASGTVIEVGLRVTKLRGDEGEIWYIRNGEVKRIGNLSQGWSTAAVDVQVGYDQDLDHAHAIIVEVAADMAKDQPWDETLWEPVEVLGLDSVTAEAVVIRAQAKTMPGKAAAVSRELRWRIKKAFDAAGVAIVGATAAGDAGGPGGEPTEAVAAAPAHPNPHSPQSPAASPITSPDGTTKP